MKETFHLVVEQGEDGYLISTVVELPGCHSQGKTYDQLLERTKEAIKLYLQCKEQEDPLPKFLSLQQLDVQVHEQAATA